MPCRSVRDRHARTRSDVRQGSFGRDNGVVAAVRQCAASQSLPDRSSVVIGLKGFGGSCVPNIGTRQERGGILAAFRHSKQDECASPAQPDSRKSRSFAGLYHSSGEFDKRGFEFRAAPQPPPKGHATHQTAQAAARDLTAGSRQRAKHCGASTSRGERPAVRVQFQRQQRAAHAQRGDCHEQQTDVDIGSGGRTFGFLRARASWRHCRLSE